MNEEQIGREGRRRRRRAEADQLAAEYEASGLSREEFCNRSEVALKSLPRYVTRYRKQKGEGSGQPRWVAVEVAARATGGGELMVHLSGGRRIEVKRGFDAKALCINNYFKVPKP